MDMVLLCQTTRWPWMLQVGIAAAGLLTIAAQLGGCALNSATVGAGPRPTLLLHTLGNVSDAARARKKADRRLLRLVPATNPARLAVLMRIIAGYGQSPKMKIYAMNQLMAADPSLGLGVLARQIPLFQHWRVLIHACSLAQAAGDRAMVDPLILSLDRPAHRFVLVQRPEADAIRALTGSTLRDCLADKLFHAQIMAVRMAALNLLHQLLTRGQFYALIMADKQDHDPMLAALRWYGRRFYYIPQSAEQVAWIEELYNGAFSALARRAEHDLRMLPVSRSRCRVSAWSGRHEHPAEWVISRGSRSSGLFSTNNLSCAGMPQGIPPRMIGLLAALTDPRVYVPRNILLNRIKQAYTAYPHIRRPGPYPGSPDNPDPSLADNSGKLCYGDLLVLQTLYAALRHRNFRVQVTYKGDQSRFNKTSEEGGLIQFWNNHRFGATGQTPALRLKLYDSFKQINNGVYVTGPDLLLNTPAGLAQFVFHFQKSDNRRYTGPAPGDLQYVRTARCVVVIFTSTSRSTFDTTADFPNGAVLDLGIFKKCHRVARPEN